MNTKCDRSATYTKVMGRAMGCPTDAQPVTLVKARGEVPANLCSQHVKAYRAAGIEVRS